MLESMQKFLPLIVLGLLGGVVSLAGVGWFVDEMVETSLSREGRKYRISGPAIPATPPTGIYKWPPF